MTKLCKRCGLHPVVKPYRTYCSKICSDLRNYTPDNLKVGVKKVNCKKCGELFVIQYENQLYCENHRPHRKGQKGRPKGSKNSEPRKLKPNYTHEEREMLIKLVLRQYGRKPKEWQS